MNLENTQTQKNLARAYVAETHDGTRYQLLSQLATGQKQHFVAQTLKQLSNNEMAHAKVWWDLINQGSGDESNNIDLKAGYSYERGDFVEQFAIASEIERQEGEEIYIQFAKIARKEGFTEVAEKFEQIAEVERSHSMILCELYDGLKNNSLYKENELTVWRCCNCGHEQTSKSAWKACPLCGMPQGFASAPIKIDITPQPNV